MYLRGYHPLRRDIPCQLRLINRGLYNLSYNTTSSIYYYIEFSLSYVVFARRYLRHRNCFLFLHLLRCFSSVGSQSSRIIFQKRKIGSPIRQSWVQRMCAPRPSLSQLTTTLIGNSSQAIPQIV